MRFEKEIRIAKEIMENFINKLGLDGKNFCRIMKFPVVIYNNVIFANNSFVLNSENIENITDNINNNSIN